MSIKKGKKKERRIVQSGVAPGETVVKDGVLRLVPGALVSIRTEGSAEKTP